MGRSIICDALLYFMMDYSTKYVGQRFGKLLVIQLDDIYSYNCGGKTRKWLYKCDCGYEGVATISRIKRKQQCPQCNKKEGTEKHRSRVDDFTGRIIGNLTVIERVNSEQRGHTQWKCQCKCGAIVYRNSTQLRHNEDTHSCPACGKLGQHIKILSQYNAYKLEGQQFGNLTPLYREHSQWICKCACGNLTKVRTNSLVTGQISQCEQCRATYSSNGEAYVAGILDSLQQKYTPQKSFKGLVGPKNKRLRFDFYFIYDNKQYLLEIDGRQHHHQVDYFGSLDEIQKFDAKKDKFCEENKINLIRLNYDTMQKLKEDVNSKLLSVFQKEGDL